MRTLRIRFYIIFTLPFCIMVNAAHGQSAEQKIKDMGITLFEPTKPVATYVKTVRTGNLVFVSGHTSQRPDGTGFRGKLGKDLTIEQGYEAAKLTAINLLSTLKVELGELDRIKRIVKVTGFVNSAPDFGDQPKVINGCSDLLVAVFGEKGKHARSAVGMGALPSNYAVEVELIVEVEP